MFPKEINNFIEEFSKLPSVGPRMATRLAFYISSSFSNDRLKSLTRSLIGLSRIDRCPKCFFIKDKKDKLCSICSDSKRDEDVIAIVEKETDLVSVESPGVFKGVYLVLGESTGRGSLTETQNKRINILKRRISKDFDGKVKEIIVAVDSNSLGDLIFRKIHDTLSNEAQKITRLARGLPTGAEVEFADEDTLTQALEGRR